MFSNSSKYALKAVLYLAVNASESNKIMAKNLSEPINVPQAYISKLLQDLTKHGVVSSTRGPNGGFYLNEKNMATPLINVITIIDGDSNLNACLLSINRCNSDHPCPLHDFAASYRENLLDNLEHKTIEDMVKDIKNEKSFLPF
ncbi:Rrf2 family transcriptional regulator [Maribacter sp. TH_r10]|uniref:Rrf2 family transcriptional regulator n=1 Tax=Maribacter luteus TaxID=2594478 RepID=A0A6I2MI46_9FLAO|nr:MULTISPECIES: Rrf2 family transcriptional regulator [Maribacter]MDV7139840.1 Rrf2 family transcriptional regulator [Maribacter sp. TH_r10]MRX63513.1 Rrf2 family transcriptional regulator [Maribacter luteus]|tara:strand:+ start:5063 stop:5494 length:432 start_codon:yes stop_codon:yes gene_type:complete